MTEAYLLGFALIALTLIISILDTLDVIPWFLDPANARLMYEVLGLGFLAGIALLLGSFIFTAAGWLV